MLNSRIRSIISVFLILHLVYAAYLFYLSIGCHKIFQKKAIDQYCLTINIDAPRGNILDRHEMILATDKEAHDLYIAARSLRNRSKIEYFLFHHFPSAYERLIQHSYKEWLLLEKNISDNQRLLITQSGLSELIIIKTTSRWYNDQSCGPVVGRVNSKKEGLFGIESLYQHTLQGTKGHTLISKEGRNSKLLIDQKEYCAPQQGDCVRLTIDQLLQFLIFQQVETTAQRLNARYAAVLVVDPKNGDIIAMVNYPSFDPNDTKNIIAEHTTNRIYTHAYEFGSIMKIVPLLGLLEDKLVTAQELIDCHSTKEYSINNVVIRTWKEQGLISFSEVIESSNNIGIAKATLSLGNNLYKHYTQLGFGNYVQGEWPGQQKGFVNPPKKWSNSSLFSLSFGYEVRATLLQLAHAWCILARRGSSVPLRLVKNNVTPAISTPVYSAKACQEAIEILKRVVSKGTAYRAQLKDYVVWGKTGTANLIIDGAYSKEHNIYTFAGVIEKDNYQRLIITCVKDIARGDVYASNIAVPLFRDIAEIITVHESLL